MAVRFDAATDRISHAGSPPDPATGITLAGWVYVVAANGEGNQTFARVHAASGASTSITFATDGNPPAGPGYFTAGGSITSDTQNPAGEWRMVAVTCTGTTGRLYAAAPGGPTEVDTGTVAGAASPTGITLGGRSPVDGSEWLNGRLAYWRLWSAVLSQAEIEAEWASAAPVRTAQLWADWPLEVHTDLLDHSGNGRHLSAGSTATTTEAGPPLPEAESADLAATVPALTAAGTAASNSDADMAAALPALATAGTGTAAATGDAAAVLPPLTAGMSATATASAALAGTLPPLTVAAATSVPATADLAAALPALTMGAPAAARDITLTASLAPQTRYTASLGPKRWTATLGAQP